MARKKTTVKKQRLANRRRQTRWAPFWTIPRVYGPKRRIHPGRHTRIKRSWKRTKIKA